MDKKTKNLIFLIGAIFIAAIFISSYAAFNNNNTGSNSTSTSTIAPAETFYATGSANATVANYSDIAFITFTNATEANSTSVQNLLSTLEANGSIENYIYANSSYELVLLDMNATTLKQALGNQSNSTIVANSISVGSDATVTLPSAMTLYYSGSPVTVYPTSRNYSVYLSSIKSIGTIVNVSVSALLVKNGSVYNNQIRVVYNP